MGRSHEHLMDQQMALLLQGSDRQDTESHATFMLPRSNGVSCLRLKQESADIDISTAPCKVLEPHEQPAVSQTHT